MYLKRSKVIVVVVAVVVVRQKGAHIWTEQEQAATNGCFMALHCRETESSAHITRHTSGRKQQGALKHAIGTHISDLTVLLWKQCSGIASCEGGVWGKEGCL